MSSVLPRRQVLQAEFSNLPCHVEELLGSGGQGEVYRAVLGGSPLALKWYSPEWATPEQRAALSALVSAGAPSAMFLWPIDLVTRPGRPSFGYLMTLREPRFRSGVELAKRRIELPFRLLITAGLHLAEAFLQLHAKGLAYRDISFGNFFLDPATGDVLICDLDNVGVDGRPHNAVGGTMRFMAPEIVRGEAAPSSFTDQFSLAVLLHCILFMGHPLEGRREAEVGCLNPADQMRLYGADPVYLMNPKDGSNRPVPGRHDHVVAYWRVYPDFLKRLFTRAFTDGLRDRAARVKESEWRAALVRLRDLIIYCGHCGLENFFDPEPRSASGPRACWNCRHAVAPPPALHVGKQVVMLNHDARLYPHHVDDQAPYDFSRPVAEVTRNPRNPDVWGLKNLTGSKWVSITAANASADVEPGRSISIAPGTRIRFGTVEGEIRLPA